MGTVGLNEFDGRIAASDGVDRCRNRLKAKLEQSKHVLLIIHQQNLILHLVVSNDSYKRAVVGGQRVFREVID